MSLLVVEPEGVIDRWHVREILAVDLGSSHDFDKYSNVYLVPEVIHDGALLLAGISSGMLLG